MLTLSRLPHLGRVGGSSRTTPCLHSNLLDLHSRSLMFDFVLTEGFFLSSLDHRAPSRP
jgi:hypothetical protein